MIDGGRAFPSTDWSRVQQLQDAEGTAYADALEALVTRYWRPVYAYVRAQRRRLGEDEALDLTQQFFAMLLERRDLQRLAPERGSLRGFLKAAVRHHLVDADRARAARRPKGEARLIALDKVDPARIEAPAPADDPAAAFDHAWIQAVLGEGLERLEADLSGRGKPLYYELFRDYCVRPSGLAAGEGSDHAPTYAELALRHDCGPGDVRNHLRYARRRMREILRAIVRETLEDGADVETELRFVLGA